MPLHAMRQQAAEREKSSISKPQTQYVRLAKGAGMMRADKADAATAENGFAATRSTSDSREHDKRALFLFNVFVEFCCAQSEQKR
jgi:hypothetical protein